MSATTLNRFDWNVISPDCLAPTKWVCFEPTFWPDTCCSVHRIRVGSMNKTYQAELDYILPTWCTDYYLFIKYYSPLHVSSLKSSSSGGYSCIHAASGNVTLYESFWWPVGTQLEWELTVGGRLLVGRLKTVREVRRAQFQVSLVFAQF